MIKLILSDMDGTLLDENNQLPAEFDEVMEELHKRGVQFAPASGRQYYSLLKSFPQYEDRFIFVSDNGTIVRQHGKELFSMRISLFLSAITVRLCGSMARSCFRILSSTMWRGKSLTASMMWRAFTMCSAARRRCIS